MNKEKINRRANLLVEFCRSAKPTILQCASLMLEDEMFYDVLIKSVDRVTVGNREIHLDRPRWFVQYHRDHDIFQLEILHQDDLAG